MYRKTRNVNCTGQIETGWLSKEGESEVKTLLAYIALFQGFRYQSLSEMGYMVSILACQYLVTLAFITLVTKTKERHGNKGGG
jgi:hypothetical protein